MSVMNSLLNYLLQNLELIPDQPAVVCGPHRLTYLELCRLIACHLKHYSNNEIQPRLPVGLILRNSPEFIVSYYSLLFYGAIPVLFPTNINSNRLTYFVNKLQIEALISQPEFQKTIDEVEIRKGDNLLRLGCDLSRSNFGSDQDLGDFLKSQIGYQYPNDTMEIVFTTGYSGYNKIVVHAETALKANAEVVSSLLAEHRIKNILVTPPLTFFGGHAFVPHAITALGGTTMLLEKTPPEELVKSLLNGEVEAVVGTPAFIDRLISLEFDADFHRSPLFLIVGSQLAPEQFQSLRRKFNATINQFYGSTETQLVFLNRNWSDDFSDAVGQPLPGWEVRLIDPLHLKAKPHEGILAVRGVGLMRGYYDDAEKSPLSSNQWFNTGDWFSYKDENYYYQCQHQERIRKWGYSFNPAGIEAIIKNHPLIAGVVAQAVHQPEGDDLLKLLILPKGELNETEMRGYCQEQLPPYLQPDLIEFVPYLDRDFTGKTLRNIVNRT